MKYSIVIPTYNKCEELSACIKSVVKNSDMNETEIIVVSNGCTDGTWPYLRNSPYVRPIRFFEPIGFPKAVNVGIQQAEGEFIVLLNNDCQLLDFNGKGYWLETLNAPFVRKDSKVAVTGVAKLSFVPSIKNTIPPQDAKSMENGRFLLFFCAMISQKIIKTLGLLDEAFTPGIGEDIDYCLRAQKNGYTIEQVPVDNENWEYSTGFPLYHISGLSFGNKPELFSRNMDLLSQRWKDGFYK